MKTSQLVKLTEKFVSAVPIPSEGKYLYLDTERKGFGLTVTAGGAKSFVCIPRVLGNAL